MLFLYYFIWFVAISHFIFFCDVNILEIDTEYKKQDNVCTFTAFD